MLSYPITAAKRPESKLLVDAMAGYGALGAPAALAAGSAYKLSSGYEMPMLGYGTFRSEPGVVKGAVLEAIKAGYRHLDLAHVYGNEKEVGQALKEAFESKIVTRGDLFLVGKLWNSDHDVDIVPQAYQKSCDDLGVEYLDLYLIHFPVAVNHTGLDNPNCGPGAQLGTTPLIDTWRAMEKLVDEKKVRSIGVSNFPLMLLHDFWLQARVKPAVNQIEVHPFYVRNSLVNYCLSRNIAVTAHTPLGGGQANTTQFSAAAAPMDSPEIKSIAEAKGKSCAQVILRWLLQRKIQVIPKSTSPGRMAANADLFDFQLSQEEMDQISALDRYQSAKTNPNPMSHFLTGPDSFETGGTDIFD